MLFAALLLLPVIGAVAHVVLGHLAPPVRLARVAQSFILPAAALGAVLCALALFGSRAEIIVGGWMPVSLMGAPLLVSITPPAAALMIALACAQLARAVRSQGKTDVDIIAHALAFAALMLAIGAANMLALFVGMGLVKLFSLIASAQNAPDRAARQHIFRHAIFQVGSLLLLAIGFLISIAGQSSLYFPLATASLRSGPFFALALMLQALSLPLYPGAIANRFGRITTLVLLMRLLELDPALLTPGLTLAALLASVVILLRAAITPNASARRLSLQTGAMLLILLPHPADPPAWVAASAIAWLLSSELLEHPAPIARLIGALGLFGVPFSAGLMARSGIAPVAAPAANIPAFILWCVAMALMAFGLFHLARGDAQPRARLLSGLAGSPSSLISFVVLALPLIAAGALLPALGLPDALTLVVRHGAAGWLGMAFAAGAGLVAAVLSPRWAGRAARPLDVARRALSFGWLEDILEGSANRVAAPFRAVFTFLESPGVLLWAIVAALLAVLISRPGGP